MIKANRTTMLTVRTILLSILVFMGCAGAASAACDPGPNQVSLYSDRDYAGPCVVKGAGDYPDSAAIGLGNDSISSIRVGQFAQVMICRDNNYGGECLTITGDVPLLTGNRVGNDMTSSLKVASRNSAPCMPGWDQASFFRDGNFSGPCVTKGPGDYPNAQAIGTPNDSISSFLVGPHAQVVLCTDNDFLGDCIVTGVSAATMSGRIGNDKVSSLRVQTLNATSCAPAAGQASLFIHSDYLAPCVTLGAGRYANASQMRIGNDQVSSVRVAPGSHVCAYKDADFRKLIADISANTPNLGPANNDAISSVAILPLATSCATVTVNDAAGGGGAVSTPPATKYCTNDCSNCRRDGLNCRQRTIVDTICPPSQSFFSAPSACY